MLPFRLPPDRPKTLSHKARHSRHDVGPDCQNGDREPCPVGDFPADIGTQMDVLFHIFMSLTDIHPVYARLHDANINRMSKLLTKASGLRSAIPPSGQGIENEHITTRRKMR
jgi:hypothetical protein